VNGMIHEHDLTALELLRTLVHILGSDPRVRGV
jgi:hypothetical protein